MKWLGRRAKQSICFVVLFSTTMPVAAQEMYFVHVEGLDLAAGTGAFLAVCVPASDAGAALAKEKLGRDEWFSGQETSVNGAIGALPTFGLPAVVGAECLQEFRTKYEGSFASGPALVVIAIPDS